VSTSTSTRNPATSKQGTAAGPKPWILDGIHDLLLFVGTPLLIVPVIYLARTRYSVEAIALFVAAFGACGHHLPGMMRAYGDRELFHRFRVRFIVAPLFLLAVCLVSSWYRLHTLAVVAVVWGFWHGLAQVYGFARIYDARIGSTAALTARLDLALCFMWFGLGMLHSPGRLYGLVNAFYSAGGPLIDAAAVEATQRVWLAITWIVTAAFAVNFAVRQWRGQQQNPIKLLLLGGSIGFWWYCMVSIENVILGIALFEVFHDVQYLSIVWIYNRRRVERQGGAAGRFTRFLFRKSGLMIGLYLGLIFAYGALGLVREDAHFDALQRIAIGFLAFSAFLHFYYDGFIWKVRERATREGLDLQGPGAAVEPRRVPGWLMHAAKWLLFVVPLALSAYGEMSGGVPTEERRLNLMAIAPRSPDAQYEAGLALAQRDPAAAAEHFQAAVQLKPDHAKAMFELGNLARLRGDQETALDHYKSAVAAQPENADARNNLASVLMATGRDEDAAAELRAALRSNPRHAAAHNNLGNILAARGRAAEAIDHFRLAIETDPGFREAHDNLAFQLAARGRHSEAIAAYRAAAAIEPRTADTQLMLAMALYRAGRGPDALAALAEADALAAAAPGQRVLPLAMQAWILSTHPDPQQRDPRRAIDLGRRAIELSARYNSADATDAYDACAAACAAAGDFEEAARLQTEAVTLAESAGRRSPAPLRERMDMYRDKRPYVDPNLGVGP
jgi:tetratricopeptide (TPR) repeat protein